MSSIYFGASLKSGECLNDLLNTRWCFNEVGHWLEDYTPSLGWKRLFHLWIPLFADGIHHRHFPQEGTSPISNLSVDRNSGSPLDFFSPHIQIHLNSSSWFSSKKVCTNIEFWENIRVWKMEEARYRWKEQV